MAQKKNYSSYKITAAGGTVPMALSDNADGYIVSASGGSVTLLADMIFSVTGTPKGGDTIKVIYNGGVTLSGHALTFGAVTLTAAQALTPLIIEAVYDGSSWGVKVLQDTNPSLSDAYLNGEYLISQSVPNAALMDETITLDKLAAVTGAEILMGSGTGVTSVPLSVDITVNVDGEVAIANGAITTVKIDDNAVTVDKISTALQTEVITVDVNFETGEVGAYLFDIPFPCEVTNVYAYAYKAIAGTDNGTIVFKDNIGTTMTVTTPIVFTASDPRGTAYESAVTGNNTFAAGDKLTVFTAKTTAGGKVKVSITLLRL